MKLVEKCLSPQAQATKAATATTKNT